MGSSTIAALLVLLGGVLIAVQGPINATLGRAVGSSVNAALLSFLVGTCALAIVATAARMPFSLGAVRALPWWAWTGGLCGAVFVTVAAYAAPRIGVATMLTLAVASQLVAAVVIDHVGAFGVPRHAASGGRLVGLVLVFVGALLVRTK